ncbi:DUF2066 domain-containing protein [Novilysobacter erysipheiresistens]|uniref:DUF2066 domain-containing protein n=1 Tax=Novilysobacter erysipheiresistens TaxID=1749332 RepID=A0ABU7YVP9_9GAMM
MARIAICMAVLLLASFAATAQRTEGDRAAARGVYAAEVEVNSQGAGERNAAFARALSQVLGKLSGNRNAASIPGIGQELRRAERYVDGFDYRQDEGVSASGAPSFDTILVVRFDQDKVDSLAAAMGLPIWPQPRPKPVLWLAIDDGSGPRLVGLPKAAAAQSTLERAKTRGYRLGLPNGSAAEQAVVGAIWRGDTAAVARASRRYSPPMQLIGKLFRDDGGWRADWIFVDNGKVLSRWSESGANARQVMATGADGAADALMKRYAKAPETDPAGTYRVAFTGLDSTDDYVRLSGYLQQLAVVRGITPLSATPETVAFDLDLVSGLSGFDRLVSGGDVLVAVSTPGAVDPIGLPAGATTTDPVTGAIPGETPSRPAAGDRGAVYRLR